jgi:hemerythrin-like metal-binding protein
LRETSVRRRFDFSGHTLLIAEDIEINREIMSAILEETRVAIDFAKDGKLAVSMFKENPDKYSLILMDIQMPEMYGYEATQAIRALDLERAKKIPIIAMTANVFREDIESCIAAGMNGHTGKPVDSEALFEMLQKYLTGSVENETIKNVYALERGIAWSDDLLTGNALVDMQHQRLFERVSDLVHSCEDGSGAGKLKEILDFLVVHTVRHFADEEALQLEYDYPGYEEHKMLHDNFKTTVGDLVQRFTEIGSSAELSDDVNRIVVKWLVDHIQHEDRRISEHIRRVTADAAD